MTRLADVHDYDTGDFLLTIAICYSQEVRYRQTTGPEGAISWADLAALTGCEDDSIASDRTVYLEG